MSDHHSARDRGSATVWAAAGVSVIMTVFMVGLHLGAVVIARHRAEAAADLAALAAAVLAVEGAQAACDRAREVAAAVDGTVTSCRLIGWDALVEVHVPIAVTLPGIDAAAGRARAGPVPVTDDPDPAPPDVGATPLNQPAAPRPVAARPAGRSPSATTSGRPTRTGGPARQGMRPPGAFRGHPTTRRTTGTLVVIPVPISDKHWKQKDPTRLLDMVPGRARLAGPRKSLPRLRWGRDVGIDAHPAPGPPHADRRRPARPPTWPAGGGLPRGRAR